MNANEFSKAVEEAREISGVDELGAAAIPAEKPLPELMMASYHEAIGWNACRQAMLAATLSAQQSKPSTVTRDQIRDVFMRNGFTVKEGQTDLKPYVYAAAQELLALVDTRQSAHVSVPRELLEKVCDPKSSTNRQEGRKSIRTLLKEREPAGQYNHKRIGWELERTAMGDGYYGNALRVAKDIPGLTDQDRAVLDRYATGAQHGTDHIALQNIAMRVYAAQGEGGER